MPEGTAAAQRYFTAPGCARNGIRLREEKGRCQIRASSALNCHPEALHQAMRGSDADSKVTRTPASLQESQSLMKAADVAASQAYSRVTRWAVECAWTGVHSSTARSGAIPRQPAPTGRQPVFQPQQAIRMQSKDSSAIQPISHGSSKNFPWSLEAQIVELSSASMGHFICNCWSTA